MLASTDSMAMEDSIVPSLRKEALLPAPFGARRFVIRATHERGVGAPSSRSFATATREARSF